MIFFQAKNITGFESVANLDDRVGCPAIGNIQPEIGQVSVIIEKIMGIEPDDVTIVSIEMVQQGEVIPVAGKDDVVFI